MSVTPRHSASPQAVQVAALTFLIACTAFAVDISLPALPTLAEVTGSKMEDVERLIGVFLAGYALGHLPMGMLSDRFGRRPVLIIGMTGFVIMGVGTALSQNITTLLVLRGIQGFCAASGAVLARAIARDITSGQETVRLLAFLASALGLAMVVAPMFGALFLWLFGWRGPFAVSALWGGIGLALSLYFVPETRPGGIPGSVWSMLRRGVSAFAAERSARFGAVMAGVTFCGIITLVTVSPGVFMVAEGLKPAHFAFCFALISAGYVTGALITRKFANHYTDHQLLRALSFCFLGSVVFALIVMLSGIFLLSVLTLCILLGLLGSNLGLANAVALKPLGHVAGVAAGALGTIQLLTGATFSYLSTFLALDTMQALLGVFVVIALGLVGITTLYLRGAKSTPCA